MSGKSEKHIYEREIVQRVGSWVVFAFCTRNDYLSRGKDKGGCLGVMNTRDVTAATYLGLK